MRSWVELGQTLGEDLASAYSHVRPSIWVVYVDPDFNCLGRELAVRLALIVLEC